MGVSTSIGLTPWIALQFFFFLTDCCISSVIISNLTGLCCFQVMRALSFDIFWICKGLLLVFIFEFAKMDLPTSLVYTSHQLHAIRSTLNTAFGLLLPVACRIESLGLAKDQLAPDYRRTKRGSKGVARHRIPTIVNVFERLPKCFSVNTSNLVCIEIDNCSNSRPMRALKSSLHQYHVYLSMLVQ